MNAKMDKSRLLGLIVLAALALGTLSTGLLAMVVQAPPAVQGPTGGTQVVIEQFAFTPAELRVEVGTTVTWTNKDATAHTVTGRDGTWGSRLLQPGETYSYTFAKEGVYDYACSPHPSMRGRVIVGNPPASNATGQDQGTGSNHLSMESMMSGGGMMNGYRMSK